MIRRARTGNDVRPLTNGERRAIWAAKYYPLERTDQRKEDERVLGIVCNYCGTVSDNPCFDMYGRRYCCTQHRILGEGQPFEPAPRKQPDDEDLAPAARGAA